MNALDRMTIADAMSWKFLQAYVGRAIKVAIEDSEPGEGDGRAVLIVFKTELEADQFAQFIKPGEGE